jgi:hypothetical protein
MNTKGVSTTTATTTDPATNTEDALYVLGVAGLASKKLLQKHNLMASAATVSSAAAASQLVSDHTKASAIDVGYTNTSDAVPVTTESLIPTLVRLIVNRKALIEYQRKHIKEMVALAFFRGPIQMIRTLWKFCDGTRFLKRTILLTITLSFLLFRTVSFIITNETA